MYPLFNITHTISPNTFTTTATTTSTAGWETTMRKQQRPETCRFYLVSKLQKCDGEAPEIQISLERELKENDRME